MTGHTPTTRGRGAFTLVELLIVVSIIAVALAAVLPAFSRIIESNNYAGAVNAVSATLARAGSAGREGGVVFLFDPHTRRTTLQQVEVWNPDAALFDPTAQSGALATRIPAVAFRPVPGSAPVLLPQGTGVYGLSFAHDDPQGNAQYNQTPAWRHWFDQESIFSQSAQASGRMLVNSWLFPRSHVQFFIQNYNPAVTTDPNRPSINPFTQAGADPNYFQFAETFIVRFNARGEMIGSGSLLGGVRDAYLEFPGLPAADLPPGQSLQPGDERDDLFDPGTYYPGSNQYPPVFNPEVQLRTVDQIAIVDMDRLAAASGVREPWFVRSSVPGQPTTPTDKTAYRFDPQRSEEKIWQINRWIDDNAQVIGFGRYAGQVVKR